VASAILLIGKTHDISARWHPPSGQQRRKLMDMSRRVGAEFFGTFWLWIRRPVVRVHPAVPGK
jgi:hypothetical protein